MTAHFVPSPAPNISLAIHRATEPGSPEAQLGDAGRIVVVERAMREAAVEMAAARKRP